MLIFFFFSDNKQHQHVDFRARGEQTAQRGAFESSGALSSIRNCSSLGGMWGLNPSLSLCILDF